VTLADTPTSILVVDDEESIRRPIRRYLEQQGYDVSTAGTGEDALRTLAREPAACVLLDVYLPDGSGVELVPRILAMEPGTAVLMLTAVNDATTATLCMQRGAMDYLTKPVDLAVLGRAIQRALSARDSRRAERISIATLEALVNALEAKDPFLRGHSARVADLSAMVASELGADDEEIERIRTAGRLHDIGKIGIREDILNKQGPLTDEEYEHVKRHVVVGSQILSPLAHLSHIIEYVRGHHERWDGLGYPDQLAGAAIPFGARVIGAVEIYDALTTSRPYQEKMEAHFAVERLRDLIGTMLDPDVHHALEAVVSRRQMLTFVDEG
jgi:putative two-component system response regulator